MSALDLTRPEHREALKLACVLLVRYPDSAVSFTMAAKVSAEVCQAPVGVVDLERALRALSSPSDSAAIVRALLEGCGVETHVHEHGDCGECTSDVQIAWDDEHVSVIAPWNAWVVRDIYALVLRLLACTTREEALAALKEAGR